jgi:hypothetical protein
MHSDYWVKWIVAEQKVQEGIDQARHRTLVDMASNTDEAGDQSWWRTVRLSVAAVGRGWLDRPATMARTMETSTRLSANEGVGAY